MRLCTMGCRDPMVHNTKISQQQAASMRYTGDFLVDEAHAGDWTFYAAWDDRIIVWSMAPS